MDSDGTAQLLIGSVDYGMGIRTTMAQVAAEELGVHIEDITVINGDTEVTPWDIGQYGSRTAMIVGNAVLKAAKDAKRQLFSVAAKMLDVLPEELEVRDRKVYVKKNPAKSVTIARAAYNSQFTKAGGDETRGQVIIGRAISTPTQNCPTP